MPPIPVYNHAPLHPQGVTPQTTQAEDSFSNPPPTQTTAAPTSAASQYSPPPAQPGARPIPPTASLPQPTASSPPAPQPGRYAPTSPAKVTATHTTTDTYLGGPVSPPAQMAYSPPASNYAPTRSTQPLYQPQYTGASPFLPNPAAHGLPGTQPSPYEAGPRRTSIYDPPSKRSSIHDAGSQHSGSVYGGSAYGGGGHSRNGSVSEPAMRHSLEHPPGYTQNPYAADGTAEERARRASIAIEERQQQGVMGNVKAAVSGVGENLRKAEAGAWRWFGRG